MQIVLAKLKLVWINKMPIVRLKNIEIVDCLKFIFFLLDEVKEPLTKTDYDMRIFKLTHSGFFYTGINEKSTGKKLKNIK